MISLVVFLGNYGREYEKTRHNAAWIFEESLPFASKLNWQSKFKGQYAVLDRAVIAEMSESICGTQLKCPASAGEKVYFLKPETYMNLSGESIGALASFYKIKPEEVLVIHDELELAPGTVSLKWSGGLGGHNGLRSTKAVLGTADFWRIRIGIGRPDHSDIAGYVLSPFSADECIILDQIFPTLSALLVQVLCKNPDTLLKDWSKKKLSAE
ncbi:MAG: aminoacyl-tRNA hydrolase [Spirochaetaceae bacterium]|nr:aminoacyl-tRNA hydrolase [Spirochaetaceae bacterium]